jgi:hypothetical protein
MMAIPSPAGTSRWTAPYIQNWQHKPRPRPKAKTQVRQKPFRFVKLRGAKINSITGRPFATKRIFVKMSDALTAGYTAARGRFVFHIRGQCSRISISLIMNSSRRLKIRTNERHSERDPIRLIFARDDYDCRHEAPRSFPYKKWGTAIANRLRSGLKV